MSLISGSESKIFAKGVIGNVRKAQEDSHGMRLGTPNGDLFVVCDGMGGHVGGAMASRIAVDSIVEYIGKERYATPVAALDGALQFANMQILGYANEHPEYRGMGTTACIVLIRDTDVWIAHVGDSRIYLYKGKEMELHRITKDHSFVQTLVDAGEITDEEAEHHPNKNRILKALGIKPELYPTFNFDDKPIFVKNGDIFLICSDGLSGMIPDSTIERVLGEKLTLQERGDKLIELAMQGETVQPGGQDNCTVELIEIDQAVGKESVFHSYSPYRVPKEPEKKGMNTKKMIRIALIVLGALVVIFGALVIFKPNFKKIFGNSEQAQEQIDSISAENCLAVISNKIIMQDSIYKTIVSEIATINTETSNAYKTITQPASQEKLQELFIRIDEKKKELKDVKDGCDTLLRKIDIIKGKEKLNSDEIEQAKKNIELIKGNVESQLVELEKIKNGDEIKKNAQNKTVVTNNKSNNKKFNKRSNKRSNKR